VLKLGFGPNVSIVSAFFGYLILSVIARKSYDRFQNNIVQTAGTSAASTAFMCGTLAAFEILRANRGGPGRSSRRHLLEMNSAIGQLGRLITDDPAHDGVAEVIWATLRGVVLAQMIVGTSIGTRAAVVPLTIAAIPFIGRVVEAAIREVDQGLVEAARAFGASPLQIVRKVLLPEALPALTLALTLTLVSLLGYSAMVGAVGGGGLGDLGIRYGYQRFMPEVMAAVVIVLIVLVQGVQSLGETIARRLDKRSRNS